MEPSLLSEQLATVSVAGIALLPVLVWAIQALREGTGLPARYLPLATVPVALALVALRFLPAPASEALVTGLGLAAAANMTIRYAKHGGVGGPAGHE